MNRLLSRLRLAWAVLCGRIILPSQLEDLQLMADLTKTAASIAALSASADRLIAANADNANQLAAAQQTIASADDDTSSSIDAITAKIDAVVPAPAPVVEDTVTTR